MRLRAARLLFALAPALLAGCAVRAPRVVDVPPPRAPLEAPALLRQLVEEAPRPANLTARLEVSGAVLGIESRTRPIVKLLYASDRGLVLRFESPQPAVGGLVELRQRGDEAAMHLIKEGAYYRGPAQWFRHADALLLGLVPEELALLLLLRAELAEAVEAGFFGLRRPGLLWGRGVWRIEDRRPGAVFAEYRVDRETGLPRGLRLEPPGGRAIEVRILEYAPLAEGSPALWPSLLDIRRGPLRLQARVERILIDRQLPERYFRLAAPPGLDPQPLRVLPKAH